MNQADFAALDPGIRLTVRWLREHNFETTDSGDGVSKPEDERALHEPHVFIHSETAAAMVFDAIRLRDLLESRGIEPRPSMIQAMYDPVDGSSIVMLLGVNDDLLVTAPRTTSARNSE